MSRYEEEVARIEREELWRVVGSKNLFGGVTQHTRPTGIEVEVAARKIWHFISEKFNATHFSDLLDLPLHVPTFSNPVACRPAPFMLVERFGVQPSRLILGDESTPPYESVVSAMASYCNNKQKHVSHYNNLVRVAGRRLVKYVMPSERKLTARTVVPIIVRLYSRLPQHRESKFDYKNAWIRAGGERIGIVDGVIRIGNDELDGTPFGNSGVIRYLASTDRIVMSRAWWSRAQAKLEAEGEGMKRLSQWLHVLDCVLPDFRMMVYKWLYGQRRPDTNNKGYIEHATWFLSSGDPVERARKLLVPLVMRENQFEDLMRRKGLLALQGLDITSSERQEVIDVVFSVLRKEADLIHPAKSEREVEDDYNTSGIVLDVRMISRCASRGERSSNLPNGRRF